jgi:hypothetical protein
MEAPCRVHDRNLVAAGGCAGTYADARAGQSGRQVGRRSARPGLTRQMSGPAGRVAALLLAPTMATRADRPSHTFDREDLHGKSAGSVRHSGNAGWGDQRRRCERRAPSGAVCAVDGLASRRLQPRREGDRGTSRGAHGELRARPAATPGCERPARPTSSLRGAAAAVRCPMVRRLGRSAGSRGPCRSLDLSISDAIAATLAVDPISGGGRRLRPRMPALPGTVCGSSTKPRCTTHGVVPAVSRLASPSEGPTRST